MASVDYDKGPTRASRRGINAVGGGPREFNIKAAGLAVGSGAAARRSKTQSECDGGDQCGCPGDRSVPGPFEVQLRRQALERMAQLIMCEWLM